MQGPPWRHPLRQAIQARHGVGLTCQVGPQKLGCPQEWPSSRGPLQWVGRKHTVSGDVLGGPAWGPDQAMAGGGGPSPVPCAQRLPTPPARPRPPRPSLPTAPSLSPTQGPRLGPPQLAHVSPDLSPTGHDLVGVPGLGASPGDFPSVSIRPGSPVTPRGPAEGLGVQGLTKGVCC